jgi:hypothetical protein
VSESGQWASTIETLIERVKILEDRADKGESIGKKTAKKHNREIVKIKERLREAAEPKAPSKESKQIAKEAAKTERTEREATAPKASVEEQPTKEQPKEDATMSKKEAKQAKREAKEAKKLARAEEKEIARLLREDDQAPAPAMGFRGPGPARVNPRQHPRDLIDFANRSKEEKAALMLDETFDPSNLPPASRG